MLIRRTRFVPWTGAALAILAGLLACTGENPGQGILAAAKNQLASSSPGTSQGGNPAPGTGLSGSLPVETSSRSPSPSPAAGTAGATPDPGASRTPAPGSGTGGSPGPSPTAYVYRPYSTEVVVIPSTATVYLAASDGQNSANYATAVALSASVLYSDGSSNNQVTWTTSAQTVATVSPTGVVTVGTEAGNTTITATSMDGNQIGTCLVTVKADGAIEMSVQ